MGVRWAGVCAPIAPPRGAAAGVVGSPVGRWVESQEVEHAAAASRTTAHSTASLFPRTASPPTSRSRASGRASGHAWCLAARVDRAAGGWKLAGALHRHALQVLMAPCHPRHCCARGRCAAPTRYLGGVSASADAVQCRRRAVELRSREVDTPHSGGQQPATRAAVTKPSAALGVLRTQ